ncbi:uncharacterized protein M6B38_394010 [Iris pallida]|uniref:FAS1 domain-containing protein n=1 Tax=Iris pallida TaxID=29817 RepID=A0AAX6FWC4_IRIPA|nr:uncharacterized protein M6B38_394010 [Iris pallida]
MMEYQKKTRKGSYLRSLVPLLFMFIIFICLLLFLSLSLPDVSLVKHSKETYRRLVTRKNSMEEGLGELGELMVSMLPDDLPFTVFVPSEDAFERIVQLRANISLDEDKRNNTVAILSRLMGFSAIPQHLPSIMVPMLKEISFDSVSGYTLYAWKASNGTLIVNNVRSEQVDVRKGETIVHVMDGVIMDAEFKQSFETDDED